MGLRQVKFRRVILCGPHTLFFHGLSSRISYSIPTSNSSGYNISYYVGCNNHIPNMLKFPIPKAPHSPPPLSAPCLHRLLHSHNPRSRPRIPIPALIPIDTTQSPSAHIIPHRKKEPNPQATSPRNPRMCRPATAQHDIMLPVEKVRYSHQPPPLRYIKGTRQNSPVYSGYAGSLLNPLCGVNTVLVHSHAPPAAPLPSAV